MVYLREDAPGLFLWFVWFLAHWKQWTSIMGVLATWQNSWEWENLIGREQNSSIVYPSHPKIIEIVIDFTKLPLLSNESLLECVTQIHWGIGNASYYTKISRTHDFASKSIALFSASVRYFCTLLAVKNNPPIVSQIHYIHWIGARTTVNTF